MMLECYSKFKKVTDKEILPKPVKSNQVRKYVYIILGNIVLLTYAIIRIYYPQLPPPILLLQPQ